MVRPKSRMRGRGAYAIENRNQRFVPTGKLGFEEIEELDVPPAFLQRYNEIIALVDVLKPNLPDDQFATQVGALLEPLMEDIPAQKHFSGYRNVPQTWDGFMLDGAITDVKFHARDIDRDAAGDPFNQAGLRYLSRDQAGRLSSTVANGALYRMDNFGDKQITDVRDDSSVDYRAIGIYDPAPRDPNTPPKFYHYFDANAQLERRMPFLAPGYEAAHRMDPTYLTDPEISAAVARQRLMGQLYPVTIR